MSIASLLEDQLAIIDRGESIAVQHLAPSFATVRGLYARVNIDIATQCTELRA